MSASDAILNQGLDGLNSPTTYLAFISQHTAAPSAAGSNEYASTTRQACSWNAAAVHVKTNSSSLALTNSGASAVTDFGTWTLVTGGVFGIGIHLAAPVTAANITAAAGSLVITGSAP